MQEWVVQDVLVIFLVSIPVVLGLKKLRLPTILGFIVTGMLIGPDGLGWIADKARIDKLAEIGIALLLFSVGLEFSFENFSKYKNRSLLGAFLQIGLCIGMGLVIGKFLDWTTYRSLYFGCIISLSSTAVVLTTLFDKRLVDSSPGRFATIILITQDFALFPMLILLQWWGLQQKGSASWHVAVFEAAKVILLILSVIFFIRFFVNWCFRHILSSRSREIFIITVIAVALGMSWLTQKMGLSFALGAFLGGIIIGATNYKYQALSEISPFRYAFNTLFFVSIGMLVNFSFIKTYPYLILTFVVLVPLVKSLISTFSFTLFRIPLRIALITGIYIGQIGEFSFLLAYIGLNAGVIQPFFYDLIIATAVMAMLLTPMMINLAPKISNQIVKLPFIRKFVSTEKEEKMQSRAEQMTNHVIICGFGALGKALGKILKEHKIPYLILDINPDTIEEQRKKQENIMFGDGASEEVMFHSGIERARLLAITVPDYLNSIAIIEHARKLNPDIQIITRSKYRNEVELYYEAKANIVISEELESGIEMGRYTLKELGFPQNEVDDYIKKIREFGSADFF